MNGDNYQDSPPNPVVFLDIWIGPAKAGRVVCELFSDKVPKTAENFRALCTGEKGISKSGVRLHLKNALFHRVVPMFMIQGGDITKYNGTGGESIYGRTFEDENFSVLHDKEGILGMANNGPNSNSSQFYITTVLCSHLDDRNVAFGIVRKGLNIIREVTKVEKKDDRPLQPVVIKDCGELKPGEDWCIEEKDCTEDTYPPWPDDWEVDVTQEEKIITAINKIKESGNYFFKNKNLVDSERKYIKALRYIDWFISLDKNANKSKVAEVRMSSLLNLTAVCLNMKKYKRTDELCSQFISKDDKNPKAFYRRGKARLAMDEHDKALEDLQMANNLLPNDKNIQSELSNARRSKLSYLQREKQFCGNFFK